MVRLHFKEISVKRVKTGTCHICGRKGTRTCKFIQTVNPYNRNSKGKVKTEAEIAKELLAEAKRWSELPFIHARCEGTARLR